MASINCGNCGRKHESVDDVRKCYAGQAVHAVAVREEDRITDRQLPFLTNLRKERGLSLDGIESISKAEATAEIKQHLSPQGKLARQAYQAGQRRALRESATLDRGDGGPAGGDLGWADTPSGRAASAYHAERGGRELPVSTVREAYPDVPAGHYAVASLTGNNDLDFFRVDRPADGPYRGRTFVKRVIGGRPNVNVRGRTAVLALKAILAEGIEAAGQRYGVELGQCCRCNRHLTDATSRALGIGPDCRAK